MAILNLNFHQPEGRRIPTEDEIHQIEGLARSVEAISKSLHAYACNTFANDDDITDVCLGVSNALELLIDPVIEYMTEYAGIAAPETEEKTA